MNLKIVPAANRTAEVIHALRLHMGPTQVLPGCIQCLLSQDSRDSNIILYQEEWSCWTSLEKSIRSERFARILELMEMSNSTPLLTFQDVQEVRGIDYVRQVRQDLANG